MGISGLVDGAIALSRMLAPLIPVLGTGADIAENVEKIFEGLKEKATPTQQQEMQVERAALRERVIAKAKAEAAALRG